MKHILEVQLEGTARQGGENDVDAVARKFVEEARKAGHTVSAATLSTGNNHTDLLAEAPPFVAQEEEKKEVSTEPVVETAPEGEQQPPAENQPPAEGEQHQ